MKTQIKILILAAGQGKRMAGGNLPKVLQPVLGQPIIVRLLESVAKSGVDAKPAIVVGYGAESVRKTLGERYIYIYQDKLLGTGHAVKQARMILEPQAENILVLYGDHPLTSAKTIENLAKTHLQSGKVLTEATALLPDFNGWRLPFYDFGRVIRGVDGRIQRIVEVKDAAPEEKEIREINVGMYCFRGRWLWPQLNKLKNNNAQREYYLTDLVTAAIAEGEEIAALSINPRECLGINTKEQLELVERLVKQRNR